MTRGTWNLYLVRVARWFVEYGIGCTFVLFVCVPFCWLGEFGEACFRLWESVARLLRRMEQYIERARAEQ